MKYWLAMVLCGGSVAATAGDFEDFLRILDRTVPAGAVPASGQFDAERIRAERLLAELLPAYGAAYPAAPPPRLVLTMTELPGGMALSYANGMVLINPFFSRHLQAAELQAVLAHELAHVGRRHGWTPLARILAGLDLPGEERMALAFGVLQVTRDEPASVRLKHDQELQADLDAYHLLLGSGLDPAALRQVLETAAVETNTPTHPGWMARQKALAGLAAH